MPEFLVDSTGARMHISQSGSPEIQLDQYNVYRLVQLLDQVDEVSALPPVTEPQFSPDQYEHSGTPTVDDQIYTSIYYNYRSRQEQAAPVKR